MSQLSALLRQYTQALEAGDSDAVGTVLDIACWDMQLSEAIFRWQ